MRIASGTAAWRPSGHPLVPRATATDMLPVSLVCQPRFCWPFPYTAGLLVVSSFAADPGNPGTFPGSRFRGGGLGFFVSDTLCELRQKRHGGRQHNLLRSSSWSPQCPILAQQRPLSIEQFATIRYPTSSSSSTEKGSSLDGSSRPVMQSSFGKLAALAA